MDENLSALFAEAVRESLKSLIAILRDPNINPDAKINAADAVLSSEMIESLETWR